MASDSRSLIAAVRKSSSDFCHFVAAFPIGNIHLSCDKNAIKSNNSPHGLKNK